MSPANILVDQHTGVVTLIDFGISEECSPTSLLENSHMGKIEGTLEYISPEQTGRTDVLVDFRSDLYSLGMANY
jgi:histidine kinase